MSDQVVPNTDAVTVARMAVAWEIVTKANYPGKMGTGRSSDELKNTLIKAFNETYNALLANERGDWSPET